MRILASAVGAVQPGSPPSQVTAPAAAAIASRRETIGAALVAPAGKLGVWPTPGDTAPAARRTTICDAASAQNPMPATTRVARRVSRPDTAGPATTTADSIASVVFSGGTDLSKAMQADGVTPMTYQTHNILLTGFGTTTCAGLGQCPR